MITSTAVSASRINLAFDVDWRLLDTESRRLTVCNAQGCFHTSSLRWTAEARYAGSFHRPHVPIRIVPERHDCRRSASMRITADLPCLGQCWSLRWLAGASSRSALATEYLDQEGVRLPVNHLALTEIGFLIS